MQYSTKRTRCNCLLRSIVDNKKAEQAVSTLTVQDVNRETRLDVLIEKLDNAFKDQIVEDTYSIYLKFINLKKQPSMAINDYILEFENLNHVNFGKVNHVVINDINTEVMTVDDNCFEKAKLNELNNWKTYEEIPYEGIPSF